LIFGCKIYAYDDGSRKEYAGEVEAVLSTISNAMKETDRDPEHWKLFRSLFISMQADVVFDLSDKLKNSLPVFGDRLKVEGLTLSRI
jgi:hypothetical protein